MKIYIQGFGCSSSIADSEVLAGCLTEAGHTIVTNLADSDLVIYNTCAVKGPTEDRLVDLLKRVPRDTKLIVGGCLPLINLERLQKEVRFDGVVGPAFGRNIVKVVEDISRGKSVVALENALTGKPELNLPRIRVNPQIAIIPISYGCTGSCSYCCVRFARGKLRSYLIPEIIGAVERDLGEGIREFWLTSQDTACYGEDIGSDLPTLLRKICKINDEFLVRVGMMNPRTVNPLMDPLLEAFEDNKVFKFLHLPVQSGDVEILDAMYRGYSVEDFTRIIGDFRRVFPLSTIATDVIVGFPEETQEAFRNTYDLIQFTRPDIVNLSKFFARPKTRAKNAKPVDPSIVKLRSKMLSDLIRRVSMEKNTSWIGWRGKILVDETGKNERLIGRNFAYKPVVVSSTDKTLLGRSVSVVVRSASQSCLIGEFSA
ncbi:MAG: tRNA (N(6)-L-threonylcarbamoyladenosine(37)-C(2))-methylthiotransferase [Candidatus Bathyarchaeota archaeon]|nr:MAG: tRNA (N(6)-L-threonylcarbamoyladenosine(37)-C(2))-methylthiotransferase [Candidatus Bathyarchaeota archaeon]